MSPKNISMSFEDLLFVHRNRIYGAYVLRKIYNRHLTMVFLFSLIPFASLLLFDFFRNQIADPLSHFEAGTKEITFSIPDIPYVKLVDAPNIATIQKPASFPGVLNPNTRRFVPPKIVPDMKVSGSENLPSVFELMNADPALHNNAGTPFTGERAGNGMAGGTENLGIVKLDTIHDFVQIMPEFPGGDLALSRYLYENIHFPRLAYEAGIQGTVLVEFVIEGDGTISNVTVRKSIGGGCEEEAVRVVEKMPRWKPGMQNGFTARVRYVLPVLFKIRK